VFPHWAGIMFWWMAKNLITSNTYDSSAAGLVNSAVKVISPTSHVSRIIPSKRSCQASIHGIPPTIDGDLWSKVAQIPNKGMFIFGRYHNLLQWDIWRFWIWHCSKNLKPWLYMSWDCQKICYSKAECGFSSVNSRVTHEKSRIWVTWHAYLWRCIDGHVEKNDSAKLNSATMQCISLLCSLLHT
jgi:hypothetical protein